MITGWVTFNRSTRNPIVIAENAIVLTHAMKMISSSASNSISKKVVQYTIRKKTPHSIVITANTFPITFIAMTWVLLREYLFLSPTYRSRKSGEWLRSDVKKKRAMQDSNPRLRLRRPEGYPDYPNRPVHPSWLPFLKEMAQQRVGISIAIPRFEKYQ